MWRREIERKNGVNRQQDIKRGAIHGGGGQTKYWGKVRGNQKTVSKDSPNAHKSTIYCGSPWIGSKWHTKMKENWGEQHGTPREEKVSL